MHRHSLHEVRPDAFNYVWDNGLPPVLAVESGAEVELHVRDAADEQISPGSGVDAVAGLDFSHVNPVSGPVEVRGAVAGDVLAVEILEFAPRLGLDGADPRLRPARRRVPGSLAAHLQGRLRARAGCSSPTASRLPYEPFPGTIGVAPAEPGEHAIVPPSDWGGNMDIKHLRAGSTLYLPVGVDGALFSVGDTHAAMGDAEVCGTAVETAMDITVRLTVRRDLRCARPSITCRPASWPAPSAPPTTCAPASAPDLMEASRRAVRAMIEHLGDRHGLERQEAYALVSVACDLRIHELVDVPNWVVGAFLPEDIFEGSG